MMKLNEKTKNTLSLLLRVGLSVLLLAYLFHKIDIDKMKTTLQGADVRYMYYAFGTFIIIHMFLLNRWAVFIRALGLKISLKNIVNGFFIGLFFNLFLPTSTGGDIVKAFVLFKDTDEKAKVVASVVLDRLIGFFTISFVALISFAAGYRFVNDGSLLLPIILLACLSTGIMFVLFNETLFEFCCRVFNRLPKVKEKLMDLHYAVALLKGRRYALVAATALSALSQATLAFTFFLLSKGFHEPIAMAYLLIFVPIICVVSSLPSIGGLGLRDAGAAVLFAKVGVATATSVSITLVNFLFMVIIGLVGGAVYVAALSPRRVQHYSPDPVIGREKT